MLPATSLNQKSRLSSTGCAWAVMRASPANRGGRRQQRLRGLAATQGWKRVLQQWHLGAAVDDAQRGCRQGVCAQPTQQVELVAQAALAVKVHPAVHPAVGLRRASYRVVDGKTKLASRSLGVLMPRKGGGMSHVAVTPAPGGTLAPRGPILWRPRRRTHPDAPWFPPPPAPPRLPRRRRTEGAARCMRATWRPSSAWSTAPPSRRESITMNAPRAPASSPTWCTSGMHTVRVSTHASTCHGEVGAPGTSGGLSSRQ